MNARWLLLGALLSVGCHKLLDLEPVVSRDGGGRNLDDSGGDAPTPAKIVFLTSVFATGALGGLAGADAHCQQLALAAKLPGTYMAWLSTPTQSPASRMVHSTIPYALVGGAVIADNWDDLVDGQLKVPILLTEAGEGPAEGTFICQGSEAWSNTNADGTWSGDAGCAGWTTTTGTGTTGRYTAAGAPWTETECVSVACGISLPLYCFQQ